MARQFYVLMLFGAFIAIMMSPVSARADPVILAYFNVTETPLEDADLSRALFEEQLNYIELAGIRSRPVTELQSGEEKSVTFTFENADRTNLDIIEYLINDKNHYVVVLISTNKLTDDGFAQALKTLSRSEYMTLGIHGTSYKEWSFANEAEFRADLNRALGTFRDVIGQEPEVFAFPYGLYTEEMKEEVLSRPFAAVLGQASGALAAHHEVWPRFTITEQFGALERFETVLDSSGVELGDVTPRSSLITETGPKMGFTLPEGLDPARLNCFLSGYGAFGGEIIGTHRIELRPVLTPGQRSRVNCTIPIDEDRTGWIGFLIQADISDASNPAPVLPESQE